MTHLPDVDLLDLELDNGWLTLWFNSETNRNALSDQMVSEMNSVLDAVRDDRTVRGITLRGRHGAMKRLWNSIRARGIFLQRSIQCLKLFWLMLRERRLQADWD